MIVSFSFSKPQKPRTNRYSGKGVRILRGNRENGLKRLFATRMLIFAGNGGRSDVLAFLGPECRTAEGFRKRLRVPTLS
jgi:hypothetical protein